MSINSMERSPQKQKLPRGVELSSSIVDGFNHPEDGAINQWDVTAEIPIPHDHNNSYRAPESYPRSSGTSKRLGEAALSSGVRHTKR